MRVAACVTAPSQFSPRKIHFSCSPQAEPSPDVFLFLCACSLNKHAPTRGSLLGTSCMQWTCVTAFSSFSLCTRGAERRRADALRPNMFLFVCACSLNKHARTRGPLFGTSCMQWTCVTAFSSCSLCKGGVERRRADALCPRMFLFVCACSLCSLRHHLQTYTQRNPASNSGAIFVANSEGKF